MFFQALAIACGAGLASALLFVVAAKGTMLAAMLTALAPLPLMIAGLGWTHWSGLLAGCVGALAISLALPFPLALIFALALAAPSWHLARTALLADPPLDQPEADAAAPRVWYPVQRLIGWATAIGAAVAIGWLAMLLHSTGAGFDLDRGVGLAAGRLAQGLEGLIGRNTLPQGVTSAMFADTLLRALAPAAAASTTVMMLVNLWAAARVVEMSGRQLRPRAAVALEFVAPRALLVALAGGLTLAFVGGLAGMLGWIAASAAFTAYALQGLATLHVLTRDWPQRRTALLALYAVVLFFAWSLAIVGLVGVADALFGLRARALAKSPPTKI